jgi:outer membrane receptor protein involved in Fe transport
MALALPAGAQQVAQGEEEEQARRPGGFIEEIVVTATKREENIQDVPIAMSAVTGADLLLRGIEDLGDLSQVSPSLELNTSNSESNGATARIRGVGTTGNNPGLEAAVGIFIDNIYRSRSGQAYTDLLDVERVEVLRGPQGTLFGKNTVAGAVHIITKKPEFQYGVTGSFTLGNFDLSRGTLSVTGPLIEEQLAFRAAGYYHERQGYYDDVGSSDKFNDRDRWGVKGQLLWTPRDDLDVRVIYEYAEKDESCCPAVWRFVGPTGLVSAALGGFVPAVPSPVGAGTNVDADSLDVGTNSDPFEDQEEWGLSIEANWDLEWATLTSVTGWRDFEVFRAQDLDFTDIDLLEPQFSDERFRNFSSELRLAGASGPIDWLFGGYFLAERINTDEDIRFATQGGAHIAGQFGLGGFAPLAQAQVAAALRPSSGYHADWDQNQRGWSLFTHNTWHLTERMRLTAGYRWSVENKQATAVLNGATYGTIINEPFCGAPIDLLGNGALVVPFRVTPAGIALCDNLSWKRDETEREWTGTLKLAYQLTDDINAYGGFSRGYKAGGYNLDQQAMQLLGGGALGVENTARFDPELSDAYELGVKATLLDNRLTVNSAVFYTEFEDFQLNTFTGIGFVVSNVSEVTTRGVEVETSFSIGDGVYATLGGTYAIARYASNLLQASLAGQRITHSPRFAGSASLFAERALPGSGWVAFVNSNASYRSDQNTGSDLDRVKVQNAVWLLNGQIGLRSPDGRWQAALWANNLTDKRYDSVVFDSVFQSGSFSTFMFPPRMWGVTVTASY